MVLARTKANFQTEGPAFDVNHTAPSPAARLYIRVGRGQVSEARLLSSHRALRHERASNRSACNHAAARKGRPTAIPNQASQGPHRTQTQARPLFSHHSITRPIRMKSLDHAMPHGSSQSGVARSASHADASPPPIQPSLHHAADSHEVLGPRNAARQFPIRRREVRIERRRKPAPYSAITPSRRRFA